MFVFKPCFIFLKKIPILPISLVPCPFFLALLFAESKIFFMDRSSQCHSQNADSPFSLVRSQLSIIPHYRQPITFHKRRFSILIGPFLIDSCQLTPFLVICIIFGPIRGRYLFLPIPLYYSSCPTDTLQGFFRCLLLMCLINRPLSANTAILAG